MQNIKINKYIMIGVASVLLYIVLYVTYYKGMGDWNLTF